MCLCGTLTLQRTYVTKEHTLTRITSHVVESAAFPLPSVCSKFVHDHLPLNSQTQQYICSFEDFRGFEVYRAATGFGVSSGHGAREEEAHTG